MERIVQIITERGEKSVGNAVAGSGRYNRERDPRFD